ncbi:MAG TPA: beta-propeller fold lactonase family protein [Trebonia sp.]|jgi:6-phosphogluconolactonase (cycloisomerase 2 family)|nr:beta-propeller fold lactonase family protein [Trebonia sp.]
MKIPNRTGLVLTLGSLALAAAAVIPVSTSASTGASPVVGHTYVDGNTTPVNTIDGFARHADGSLTPLAGSPFTAGGAGLGAGLASQGAIQVTPDGRYLLAVDAGSNQISVLRITRDGVPVLTGQPVSSGGTTPVSVAVSRSGLVYVANQGNGGSGYSGLRMNHDGHLTPIAGSTVTVPDGSGLGDVFFNASGTQLIGTRTDTSQIDSFVVLPDGHLLEAKGAPYAGQGLGQLGAEFSPANPSELFVSNAHNGTGLGTVSAYRDSFFGQLSSIGSSPYPDGQTAPCWVEISHNGRYLFTVNAGSGTISSYSIHPDGSLVLIGSFAVKGGAGDTDARLSPDGKYLLVDGPGTHFVSVFAVNGGTLAEVPSSPTPLPGGVTSPAGIANT